MANKLKDWKACNRQKRFGSSNLPHSAEKPPFCRGSCADLDGGNWGHHVVDGGKKTAKKPQKMRSVNVSLYYRPQLDKEGTAPLLIAVNHASSSCYFAVQGVRLKPSQWDKKRRRVINHPQAATINSVAVTTLGRANEAVMHLGYVRGLTTRQVRDRIAAFVYPPQAEDTSLIGVMKAYMERCNNPSTADKYKQTITHLERFGAQGVQFADVTPTWLAEFDKFLRLSVNSKAIHMRNIRTICNHAINTGMTSAAYPFRQYKIKHQQITPRALTLDQLVTLWRYQPPNPIEAYWLDIWRLIFALIGINMADLSTLDKVQQGRVNYTRQKTGRSYSVKVEPVAAGLIAAHHGSKHLLDILERYKSVHVATCVCNKNLKRIAESLGLPPVTTYTARYTWATLAASLDIPIEVISQALGHTYGQAVTLGYIMPDRRKVDKANCRILAIVTKQQNPRI